MIAAFEHGLRCMAGTGEEMASLDGGSQSGSAQFSGPSPTYGG